MPTLDELEKRIIIIERRNREVSLNKAWETSTLRKVSIAFVTYITICLFFIINKTPDPFISAIVPTTGFLLSTLSLNIMKTVWIKKKKLPQI